MTLRLTEEDILKIVRERFGGLVGSRDFVKLVVRKVPAAAGDTEPRVSVCIEIDPYPIYTPSHELKQPEAQP